MSNQWEKDSSLCCVGPATLQGPSLQEAPPFPHKTQKRPHILNTMKKKKKAQHNYSLLQLDLLPGAIFGFRMGGFF